MYTQVAAKWMHQKPRLQPLQRQFLEKALTYYQRFTQEPSNTPEERLATVQAYQRVADIRVRLGDHRQAIEAYRQGQAIASELAAEFPQSAEYRSLLALLHTHLGNTLAETLAYAKAEEEQRRAVRLLESLVKDAPASADYRSRLAQAQCNLGNVLTLQSRFPQAEEAYSQALRHQRKLTAESPNDLAYQKELQTTYQNLAKLRYATHRSDEAEKMFQQAREIGERLVSRQPRDPEFRAKLALACFTLGFVRNERGRDRAIEEPLRRAEGLLTKLVEEFPDVPLYREYLGGTHNSLGIWLSDVGRNREAEAAYRAAWKVKEELVKAFPQVPFYRQDVVQACNNLTLFLREAHRLPEARKVHRRGREMAEQLVKEFPKNSTFRKDLARCHQRLAEVCQTAGDYRQSAAECRWAVELCPEEADILCGIAWVLATLPVSEFSDPARAVELARKATQKDSKSAYYWRTLGLAQYRAGDAKSAIESLERSRRLEKREPAYTLLFLSMAHARLGHLPQARRCYNEAVAIIAKSGSRDEQLLGFRAEAANLLGIQEQNTKQKEESPKKK